MKHLVLILILALTACGMNGDQSPSERSSRDMKITVTSTAFQANGDIPKKYTCQGQDILPPLEWSAPPAGTQSLAIIVDDPDAPMGTWVHWVVYNLPQDSRSLTEGASQGKTETVDLPAGALQGKNNFNRLNYGGPCPPSGQHHYRFHIYALDTKLSGASLDKRALLAAMEGHILAQGELVGLYRKQ